MERIVSIKEYKVTKTPPGFHYGIEFSGYEVITTDDSIKLYMQSEQDCCESWGYFWCNDDPSDFIGAELVDVTITDTALNTKRISESVPEDLEEGGVLFVNLETDRGTLQFVAYNAQNGYYGHEAVVECKTFTYSQVL